MTGHMAIKRVEAVQGTFNPDNYTSTRLWALASDSTKVPISVVYRKDAVKLDGSAPLLLYVYGSYEKPIDACFSSSRISLLDRGFVYAIAHVRGGGEMGRWVHSLNIAVMKDGLFRSLSAITTSICVMQSREYLLRRARGEMQPHSCCTDTSTLLDAESILGCTYRPQSLSPVSALLWSSSLHTWLVKILLIVDVPGTGMRKASSWKKWTPSLTPLHVRSAFWNWNTAIPIGCAWRGSLPEGLLLVRPSTCSPRCSAPLWWKCHLLTCSPQWWTSPSH